MSDVLDLFPNYVIPEPNTGCWLCHSANNQRGYGRLNIGGGKLVTAHRYSYELSVGPIPHGLELDHLCRQPCCVNPTHLEPVTPFENGRRAGRSKARERGFRCVNGHPETEENTITKKDGTRRCRACQYAAHYRWLERKALA